MTLKAHQNTPTLKAHVLHNTELSLLFFLSENNMKKIIVF